MTENKNKDDHIYGHWGAVKSFAVIVLIGVVAYKIIVTPFNLTFDFPSLLSLLLALFSVGLAALFYFKASETSNTFYDNTYKFTRDIAQLLAKIESGFGEKLRHLDEGYSSMRDYMQSYPNNSIARDKESIEKEEEIIDKAEEERKKLIEQLMERAQLQHEERNVFLEKLSEKEEELEKAHEDVALLKRRIRRERARETSTKRGSLLNENGFVLFLESRIVNAIGPKVFIKGPPSKIRQAFREILNELPEEFLQDYESTGHIDENMELTIDGIHFLRDLAKKIMAIE
ncbi:hypothetical protein [Desulfopila inferna]|uniref:hypothetical protein n=1 Tax=Desulfopila inferna TaxID=468528 RepID=UPI00196247EB|nr:hypothetical protein [Desulfopila inferna]MBM9606753.1 hypothetical protein [Desulfopila inferna]